MISETNGGREDGAVGSMGEIRSLKSFFLRRRPRERLAFKRFVGMTRPRDENAIFFLRFMKFLIFNDYYFALVSMMHALMPWWDA